MNDIEHTQYIPSFTLKMHHRSGGGNMIHLVQCFCASDPSLASSPNYSCCNWCNVHIPHLCIKYINEHRRLYVFLEDSNGNKNRHDQPTCKEDIHTKTYPQKLCKFPFECNVHITNLFVVPIFFHTRHLQDTSKCFLVFFKLTAKNFLCPNIFLSTFS